MDVRTVMRGAVNAWPDDVAVVDGEQRLTFGQMWDRGIRFANVLAERGVRPGDRVAALEDNTLEAADFYLACTIGNFVRVPLYPRNSAEAHRHMVEHTDCKLLVAAEVYASDGVATAEAIDGLQLLIRDQSYESCLEEASNLDPAPVVLPDDYYLIRHTAGTTGRSKGVAFTHRRWMSIFRDWLYNLPPIQRGDAFLHQSPISHGSGYFFTPTWMNGGRNVMMERPDPDLVLDLVEKERITHMLGIPTILARIVRHPEMRARDMSSVKAIMVSGAPVSEATAHAAHKIFGDALYTGFGQTEINPVTFMSSKEWFDPTVGPERIRSAGRVQCFGDICILDPETHKAVEAGQDGEIAARSDGQLTEFWGDPDSTATRLHDGWVLTGDVGRIDERGYLHIMDRAGDMIISGGFNIYPAELENVIASHPRVLEVAVFAVPDEKWGESPAAVCVVEDERDVSDEEIIELCRKTLGSYKKPSTVVVTTVPLPKSIVGKVLRKDLREPYWTGTQAGRRVGAS